MEEEGEEKEGEEEERGRREGGRKEKEVESVGGGGGGGREEGGTEGGREGGREGGKEGEDDMYLHSFSFVPLLLRMSLLSFPPPAPRGSRGERRRRGEESAHGRSVMWFESLSPPL